MIKYSRGTCIPWNVTHTYTYTCTLYSNNRTENISEIKHDYISMSQDGFRPFADAGKSFGEIALISQDAVRNASIIADEDTDLLVIDRALFNGTLKVYNY